MTAMIKNQKNNSFLQILVVLCIIAVLLLIAYLVWSKEDFIRFIKVLAGIFCLKGLYEYIKGKCK